MNINFNKIGCYRSVRSENISTIDMDVECPVLRKKLVPQKLNLLTTLRYHDRLNMNVRRGDFIDDGAGERMETILQFIEKMSSNERILKERINCDFICNRGLLVKLAMNKTNFRAVKRKNVIFMCTEPYDCGENYDLNAHMAMKFEKLMVDDPYYMKDTNNMKIVRTGIRTKIVNQLEFPGFSVLSSSEVDSQDEAGNIIELKMTKKNRDFYMNEKKSKSDLKEYLQCYLSNTEYLLIGFLKNKNYKFEVDEVEIIHRNDDVTNFKDVEQAKQNLFNHLSDLRRILEENDKAIFVNRTTNDGLDYKYIDADECDFVPKSFLSKFD